MKAPSEHHLEDYLWEHPEALGVVSIPLEHKRSVPIYTLHARQVAVPFGIIDIVASDWRLVIMELKKGTITAKAFTQLMRYMHDVYGLIETCVERYIEKRGAFYEKLRDRWNGGGYAIHDLVAGVLVGHDYEDENLLIACAACNIDVFLYDYGQQGYRLQQINTSPYYFNIEPYWELADGFLGGVVHTILANAVRPPPTKDHVNFDIIKAAKTHLDQRE